LIDEVDKAGTEDFACDEARAGKGKVTAEMREELSNVRFRDRHGGTLQL